MHAAPLKKIQQQNRPSHPDHNDLSKGVIEVCGARYQLHIDRREFVNVDDPTDRASLYFGDPLVWKDGKWQFTSDENKWLTIAALRLTDNPDLTLQEAFHNCYRDGHIRIPDWGRDIDWNEHFILIPKRCKICALRTYTVRAAMQEYSAEARPYEF